MPFVPGPPPFAFDSSHYGPGLQWLGAAISRRFTQQAASFGVGVLGDSKGNDIPAGQNTGDWPYELGALIAAAQPAWTVRHYLFSDATQDYGAPTTIQLGPLGERKVTFVSASSHTRQLPNTDVVRASVDFEVTVHAKLTDWTPATAPVFAANYGAAGLRGWFLTTAGASSAALSFVWTADGTTNVTANSTVGNTFPDGTDGWIKVTFQSNVAGVYNVKFFTSANGAVWTQLGATVVGGASSTIFQPVQPYELGGRGTNGAIMDGDLYEVRIRDGVDGPIIAPVWPDAWKQTDTSSPSPSGSPICALIVGCVPGQGITYLSNATRLKKLLPDYTLVPVFAFTQTNDIAISQQDLFANWLTWLTAIKADAIRSTPVVMNENPQFSPATSLEPYNDFRSLLLDVAGQVSAPAFDTWQSFLDTGRAQSYINADGIHPSLTAGPNGYSGAQVWARDVYNALFRSN